MKFKKEMLPKGYPKNISDYIDLRKVDFSEADIDGVDFTSCILTGAQVEEIKDGGGYVADAIVAPTQA